MKSKKYYLLINDDGWILSNQYDKVAEMVLGYGGIWTQDGRKAKHFKTMRECQEEVNKMPCSKNKKFLVVSNGENWKKEYKKAFGNKGK